jgi:uncharacterized protein YjiS (DUF1127 family)
MDKETTMTARRTIAERVRKPLLPRLWLALRAAVLRLDRAIERRNQRLALAELTDEQLTDIGLTRDDVERECRPFWRR